MKEGLHRSTQKSAPGAAWTLPFFIVICKLPYQPLSWTFLSDGPDERIKAPFFPHCLLRRSSTKQSPSTVSHREAAWGQLRITLLRVGGLTSSQPKVSYLSPANSRRICGHGDRRHGSPWQADRKRNGKTPSPPPLPRPHPQKVSLDEERIPVRDHSSRWRAEGREGQARRALSWVLLFSLPCCKASGSGQHGTG